MTIQSYIFALFAYGFGFFLSCCLVVIYFLMFITHTYEVENLGMVFMFFFFIINVYVSHFIQKRIAKYNTRDFMKILIFLFLVTMLLSVACIMFIGARIEFKTLLFIACSSIGPLFITYLFSIGKYEN
ncbi:hypothetical protein RFI36_19970 [Acinetobacter gerneri]|uniref:GtrA family protein n=1 Tax=Acinetobacter gerneri TaxID=202952 RepID=A0AAW8JME6_9GAMM|nr:hypothetical protein [Acinetobacter gerneri]MDQ9011989.1 hypothetical protein [Acinetobacter gerneri]MDQ9016094.1 hypothetical protein [Acinetobacter gerneri]MDQ9027265.1 hypothetical protein [Acinetobacter gerneri]MDQ9054564.1 hypothetical protein [Acinetobacter gerneri]MDQ9062216.1 hypothetical protein [Acinetobacter gerneri]